MNSISTQYLSKAEFWLCFSTLIYFLMNGAQIFETFVIVPKWTASPPLSLQMLQGEHALDLKSFWIIIHSIHEITFFIAIYFCWKLDLVRNYLLILFTIHFAVRVWTILYFAPNIMVFQKIDISDTISQIQVNKINLWRSLNYVRVAIFIAISIGLIPLCLKVIHMKFKLNSCI